MIPATQDTIAKKRRIAEMLASDATSTAPVGHWTQAVARALQGGVSGAMDANLDRQSQQREAYDTQQAAASQAASRAYDEGKMNRDVQQRLQIAQQLGIDGEAANRFALTNSLPAPRDPLDIQYKQAQIDKMNRESQAQSQAQSFTPAQTAVDKAFAKTYETDFASGGFADQQKNLGQITDIRKRLEGGKEELTGSVTGLMPDVVNSFLNPAAVDTREAVEEVVQRNLRLILGAQFTNEEGKRLIARAYNPRLDEQTNAARLRRLESAMSSAMEAKKAAAEYYEQNGTLRGFNAPHQFSVSDFEAAIEGDGSDQATPQQGQQAGPMGVSRAAPPPAAVSMLQGNPTPQTIQQFNEVFGPGAAERILSGGR